MNRTHLSLLLLALAAPLQAEDLTPKVKALFEAKCKECHHPDTEDDFPYLHEGFDLAELIEEEMITKGNPDESAIFRRVSMDATSKKRMPKSSGAEGDDSYKAPLTAEEQTLIRDWIAQAGDTAPAPAPAKSMTEEKKEETPAPAPVVTAGRSTGSLRTAAASVTRATTSPSFTGGRIWRPSSPSATTRARSSSPRPCSTGWRGPTTTPSACRSRRVRPAKRASVRP